MVEANYLARKKRFDLLMVPFLSTILLSMPMRRQNRDVFTLVRISGVPPVHQFSRLWEVWFTVSHTMVITATMVLRLCYRINLTVFLFIRCMDISAWVISILSKKATT